MNFLQYKLGKTKKAGNIFCVTLEWLDACCFSTARGNLFVFLASHKEVHFFTQKKEGEQKDGLLKRFDLGGF